MKKALFLTLAVLLLELAGGVMSHSLALLSDAGHVLTDVGAIGLSWLALRQGERPADQGMTFGYYRSGILAALFNGLSLVAVTVWIVWQAYGRLHHPPVVGSLWMFISAGIGLLVNVYLASGLRGEHNVNIRSAALHMFGDAAASAGVIVAGLIILATGWYAVDPILSILIAVLVVAGAVNLLRKTVPILMEGAPAGTDLGMVTREILSIPGVKSVHDLHVWSIDGGRNVLSCHIVCAGDISVRESQTILREVENRLLHLGIAHVTGQIEDSGHPHRDSLLCWREEW
jgi:cobalt-zinc-cadmium efflux system protein